MNSFVEQNKQVLQLLFLILFLLVLFLPGYIFFDTRGGISFLSGVDNLKTLASLIFPLFGLYAFTLIWVQIMLGANMRFFLRLWPKALIFHQLEGSVAFLLVLSHVSSIILTYTFEKYLGAVFLPAQLRIYGLLGATAFYLLFFSLAAAFFRRARLLRGIWRRIHIINYFVFLLIFLHSWNLGSDIQSSILKYLWYFYGGTVLLSLLGKLRNQANPTPN